MIPNSVSTLVINGGEVKVTPTSFSAQPVSAEKRNIIKLPCGPIAVGWPGQGSTLTLSVGYDNLEEEDAEAILILATLSSSDGSGTINFGGASYTYKVLRCNLSESEGSSGWSVTLDATIRWIPG